MKRKLLDSKLIFKALLICSIIMAIGCDDDDDDSSYGAVESKQMEKLLTSEKKVVVYKA